MRLWHIVSSAVAIAGLATAQDWPLHDNGLNQVVQWYVIELYYLRADN